MKRPITIAIDGPAGAGKSTVAGILAERLGLRYVDTGSMFRVIGYALVQKGVDPDNDEKVGRLLDTIALSFRCDSGAFVVSLDGRPLGAEIRTSEIGMIASRISMRPFVRDFLLKTERDLSLGGDIVMEGRDIGTVVLPKADLKFFIDAGPEERGLRRYRELIEKGFPADLASIIETIKKRDIQDRTRPIAPLVPAADAEIIDTTGQSIDEVVDHLLDRIDNRR